MFSEQEAFYVGNTLSSDKRQSPEKKIYFEQKIRIKWTGFIRWWAGFIRQQTGFIR